MTPKILAAVSLCCPAVTAAGAADRTVTLTGMKDSGGYVIATIYDSERSFLKRRHRGDASRRAVVPPKAPGAATH
jgi:uncharacterized protein (DUF2141 family)